MYILIQFIEIMIGQQYIDRILEEVNLAEVVSSYGISLKATGRRLVGQCPFK